MSIVYLAGPINGCTDKEAHGWRDSLTESLNEVGHEVFNPMARDYRGREDENVADIVEGDKRDIDNSDIVVAFCPRPSVGTSMEVYYAWSRGLRVLIYAPPAAPISPWLRYHSHGIFHSAEAITADLVAFP